MIGPCPKPTPEEVRLANEFLEELRQRNTDVHRNNPQAWDWRRFRG